MYETLKKANYVPQKIYTDRYFNKWHASYNHKYFIRDHYLRLSKFTEDNEYIYESVLPVENHNFSIYVMDWGDYYHS